MKKENLKKLRTILIISFMAEIISIISLYLSSTQVIKIWKITIINSLALILNIIYLVFMFILFNNLKNKKNNYKKLSYYIIGAFVLQILTIIFNCFSKTRGIIVYTQVISDILKFLPIIYIYKENIKLIKKKTFLKDNRCILIILISYLLSKVSFVLVNNFDGLTIRPVFSTITVVGVVLAYTLYMKFLEQVEK